MARRWATKAQFGNMEWQARHWGYNDATERPRVEDIDTLLAANMPNVRFTQAQHSELQESADYAYMMRLRHHAGCTHIPALKEALCQSQEK